MKKRMLSVLLALTLVLTSTDITALAADKTTENGNSAAVEAHTEENAEPAEFAEEEITEQENTEQTEQQNTEEKTTDEESKQTESDSIIDQMDQENTETEYQSTSSESESEVTESTIERTDSQEMTTENDTEDYSEETTSTEYKTSETEIESTMEDIELQAGETTSGKCGDNLTWTLENGTLTISGTGDMWDYESSTYAGTGMTTAPWRAFYDQSINLKFSGNVTSIGTDAFYNCKNFVGDLIIPDSIVSIGWNAFHECSGFTGKLIIGNAVTSIGRRAFYECNGFTGDLIISDSVTSIGDQAFCSCSGFTGKLIIGNDVTSIGDQAFWKCSGFTGKLSIGSSITSIEDQAFRFCNGFTGDLILPDGIISIGSGAFADCGGFTGNLILPNSITNIGSGAFARCDGFTGDLVLSDSITSIEDSTFSECGFTGNLIIPNNVASIGNDAFLHCAFTDDLIIPDNVANIGNDAFLGCNGFTGKLTIGNHVTNIGGRAFYNCKFTGDLIIPNSVTNIGNNAFFGCESFTGDLIVGNGLTEISLGWLGGAGGFKGRLVIGNNVQTIGSGTFGDSNGKLSGFTGDLIIPNSVTTIGDYAFYGCSGFTGNLIIPDSVTSIGKSAFRGCSGFSRNLTIPNSITTIKDYTFYGCSGFTGDLIIPDSVTTIGANVFYGCNSFTGDLIIGNGVTSIGWGTFNYCDSFTGDLIIGNSLTEIDGMSNKGFTGRLAIGTNINYISSSAFENCHFTGELVIPNSVVSIGDSAFGGCNGFTGNLIIPDSVTNIGANAFYGCNGFNGKLVLGNNIETIKNNTFYNCSGFTGDLTIPDSVTNIGANAFYGCNGFNGKLVLGNNIKTIKNNTFYNCSGFTGDLIIPDSVTSIGDSAFGGCSNLTGDLIIPNSITTIGSFAFSGCSGFTGDLIISNSVANIERSAFINCNNFKGNLKIGSNVQKIEDHAFYNCKGFTGSLIIPNRLVSIGEYAFAECKSFTGSLRIPDSVTSIGKCAFKNCTGFTGNLTIGDGTISIGDHAFYGCNGFRGNLTIGNSVENIEQYAFSDCNGFRGNLTIGNSVNSIGEHAFAGCNNITGDLEIPDQVTIIGAGAFSNCTSLKSVKLPESIKAVEDYMFDGCSSLYKLTIPEGVMDLKKYIIRGTAIGSIEIPSTVANNESYDTAALADCVSLNEIIFAQGSKTIPAYGIRYISSVVIPDSIETISANAFRACNNLIHIYYGGTEQQWSKITIEDGNTPLINASKNGGIHYNASASETVTRITFVSSLDYVSNAKKEFQSGDEGCLAQTFKINWEPKDVGKTVSWQSSNPEVFQLTGETSYEYDGDPYALLWWDVRGNALSSGTSVITITTSDGAFASFEVVVKSKPNYLGPILLENTITTSQISRMKVGDSEPITTHVHMCNPAVDESSIKIQWESGDKKIIAFDKNGTGSVTKPASSLDAYVFLYALAPGTTRIVCRLFVDGKEEYECSFKVTVYGEGALELQEKALDWQTAYTNYINAVEDAIQRQKEEEANSSDKDIETKAKALMEADQSNYDKLVIFKPNMDKDKKIQQYVYQAVVKFLEEYTAGSLDFGSLDASSDLDKMATKIVNKVYNSIDIRSYTYHPSDKNVTILIEGLSMPGGVHMRTVTYKEKDGEPKQVASINSTTRQMERVIKNYLKELLELGVNQTHKAYAEMAKSIFGKSLEGMAKAKVEKVLSKYTKTFEKTGVGKVTTVVSTSIDYYQHVKKIVDNVIKGPGIFSNELNIMKAMDFESDSITDKAVKTAMKGLKQAKKSLEKAIQNYIETGSITKGTATGWWASIKCPVSIDIYDHGGNQVGHVGNDDIWYNEDVLYIEKYGDTKNIFSYGEALTLNVTATDFGKLNCSFEEFIEGEAVKRINYYDIPLYTDREISAKIPDNDLSENTIKVVADGIDQIAADESINASDYDNQTVYIGFLTNIPEGGQVFGYGNYVRGDSVAIHAIAESGYVFLGWRNSEDALVSISPDYEFTARENLTLTAIFAEDMSSMDDEVISDYTVTFDSDGGTEVNSQYIQEYEKAIEPVIPVKEGYNFGGWYLGEILFDFDTGITSDITLTANWIEMKKLSIPVPSINSGSEVKSGTKLSLTNDEGAYIYYTVDGTEPTRGDKFYVNPIIITENVTIKAFAVKSGFIDSDIAVFSYIVSTTYTVTFNSSGGTNVETQTIKDGEKVVVPSTPSKEGYTFTGWYLNGVLYDFDTSVTEDIILEAGWTEIGTVTAPSPSIASESAVKSGTALKLISTEEAKIYYTVDGTDPTENSTLYTEPIIITSNITIKAFATKEGLKNSEIKTFTYTIFSGFTVTFNSNGGTDVETQLIQEGDKAIEPIPPTREGYTFTGWHLDGVLYDFDIIVTADITLEAGWSEEGRTATPTANIASGSKVKSGTKIKLISDDGAKIYYTLDETHPTTSSTLFTEDIAIIRHTIIKAFAIKEGYKDSDIATFVYDISDYEDDLDEVLLEDIPEAGIPNGLWIAGVSDVTYTGKAIKPSVRVYDHKTRLVEKRDYTVSYKNNINANNATDESKAPSVIIKAKGNYSGKETATFKILARDINSAGFDAADIAVKPNGKVQKPIPVVTYNGKKLSNKKDYTVTYPDTSAGAYKDKNTYVVKITGKGNYMGERTVNFTITDNNLLSKAKISKIKNQQYTGSELKPAVQVKYGKDTLTEGTDYELEYRNNTEIGTASILIRGKGSYSGQKIVSFKIVGISINKAQVTGLSTPDIYSGGEITKNCYLTLTVNGNNRTLKQGQDYSLTYQNNKNAGTAVAIFTGINGYTGTLKKSFKIGAYDLQADTDKKVSYGKELSVPYAKNGSCPNPTISFKGTRLVKDKDYTLSYKNNKTVSDGSNPNNVPTIVVKGKGNFKGTLSIPFTITTQSINNLTLTAADKIYKNRANNFSTNIKITDINGKTLSAGKDYDKNSITYTYMQAVSLENGTARKAGDPVEKTDIIPADTQIQVRVGAKNGSFYTGEITGIYRITKSDIKNAKISIPAQTYTGKAVIPAKSDLSVYVGKTKLAPSEYEIVSCTNNVKKGKATIIIKGTGNYGGTKTVKYTIRSKGFLWWWRK